VDISVTQPEKMAANIIASSSIPILRVMFSPSERLFNSFNHQYVISHDLYFSTEEFQKLHRLKAH
jgi:hypothetical protein